MNRVGLVSLLIGVLVALTAVAWLTVWTPHHSVRGDLYALATGVALVGYVAGVVGSRREVEASTKSDRGYARHGRRLNAVLMIGLVLAVAGSGLMLARAPRLYTGVIGDVRSVLAAQTHFEREAGIFGELHCLEKPSACIAGYPSDGPMFIDAGLASLQVKLDYERSAHLGRAKQSPSLKEDVSGAETFAYLAVPSEELRESGPYPGICGDTTGAICLTADGSEPRVDDGLCVLTPGPAPHPGMFERLGVWTGLAASPAPGSCHRLGQ